MREEQRCWPAASQVHPPCPRQTQELASSPAPWAGLRRNAMQTSTLQTLAAAHTFLTMRSQHADLSPSPSSAPAPSPPPPPSLSESRGHAAAGAGEAGCQPLAAAAAAVVVGAAASYAAQRQSEARQAEAPQQDEEQLADQLLHELFAGQQQGGAAEAAADCGGGWERFMDWSGGGLEPAVADGVSGGGASDSSGDAGGSCRGSETAQLLSSAISLEGADPGMSVESAAAAAVQPAAAGGFCPRAAVVQTGHGSGGGEGVCTHGAHRGAAFSGAGDAVATPAAIAKLQASHAPMPPAAAACVTDAVNNPPLPRLLMLRPPPGGASAVGTARHLAAAPGAGAAPLTAAQLDALIAHYTAGGVPPGGRGQPTAGATPGAGTTPRAAGTLWLAPAPSALQIHIAGQCQQAAAAAAAQVHFAEDLQWQAGSNISIIEEAAAQQVGCLPRPCGFSFRKPFALFLSRQQTVRNPGSKVPIRWRPLPPDGGHQFVAAVLSVEQARNRVQKSSACKSRPYSTIAPDFSYHQCVAGVRGQGSVHGTGSDGGHVRIYHRRRQPLP